MPDTPDTAALSDDQIAAQHDLLGLIGCGQLFAFETLAKDCALSKTMTPKAELGQLACQEFAGFQAVSARLSAVGADPETVIGAYVPTLTEFHRKTAPRDLLEGLMKVYVGDGISADFAREIANYVDLETQEFIREVLGNRDQTEFVVPYIQQSLREDPGSAGRLALWGRRLMGEALAQAQRVAADRPDLARLVVGSPAAGGAGLVEFAQMLARLTEAHSERMQRLGLAP
ncbi:MAG: ferritin-like domain-containing protein [Actinomycetia bacterium]|nr:ferritin-like domain-containing protein [Actinomycetes bacterium]